MCVSGIQACTCRPLLMYKFTYTYYVYIYIYNRSTYFRYFKTEVDRECPFWSNDNAQCNLESCAICECNEADIPDALRTHIEFGWINENNAASTTSSTTATSASSSSIADDHQAISTEQSVVDTSVHSTGTPLDRVKLRCVVTSLENSRIFCKYAYIVTTPSWTNDELYLLLYVCLQWLYVYRPAWEWVVAASQRLNGCVHRSGQEPRAAHRYMHLAHRIHMYIHLYVWP
jgi:hypothetical protein